ncbi:MAG: DEAD/DEAH box helicase [Hyphomicrobiaceae bacterium]|nr:DEAD/DEAH box helicase [Hyphomicrobiaceae bacterium]
MEGKRINSASGSSPGAGIAGPAPRPATSRSAEATDAAHTGDLLTGALGLQPGDLVVHADHGIGRFEGLATIDADGSRDFFALAYQDGRILVPVETADLLSRYGTAETAVRLDRLGGKAWRKRKGRLEKRIGIIARRLIGIAAARELATAPVLAASPADYVRFCEGFPHKETPDQAEAIEAVLEDLASGKPMDRLICGDVGSGKTEVALRAAFHAAMTGWQVAVVAPTTLLSRQHTETFVRRFAGFPVTIAQASRLSGGKGLAEARAGLLKGDIRLVIGTHALLTEAVAFARLGLIIVDEEQRFGVRHKERLKQLREGVHVLTLTATPIPRTLQLALSLVRSLSLIVTPPAGRRPVRTVVCDMQPARIRKALLAEKERGGQSFYVCPRISDLGTVAPMLARDVPEVSVVSAHGRMSAAELDRVMEVFLARQADVLLSTTIIESGLDIPSVNTMIVHDAHRLGLAQLYQIRGRIGRAGVEAHAWLTVPPGAELTPGARRRLEVLARLDPVGAGFTVASRDMDIRGAGNLLGEEQSGHLRDVGFDLFQTMLKLAVEALRKGEQPDLDLWAPRISLGLPIRIPDSYISDPAERAEVYWSIAGLATGEQIEAYARELVAAYGPLPRGARRVLMLLRLKQMCREARVAEVVAGPKGAVLTLRPGTAAPRRLPKLRGLAGPLRWRAGPQLVVSARWEEPRRRLAGLASILRVLARALATAPDERTAVQQSLKRPARRLAC